MKTTTSCEIGDLLDFFSKELEIPWAQAEKMAFDEGIFPEGSKTFLTIQ